MGSLVVLILVIAAGAGALQTARRHGVAASPVIGWGLAIAAFVGGMLAAGALALKHLSPQLGVAVFLADIALTLVVAIAIGNRVWLRLKSRHD